MMETKVNSPNPVERRAHDDYRLGVGIMLLSERGEVFVGRRADLRDEAWQMPQSGIGEGETPQQAAFRELKEEIGTDSADVIAESMGWFEYDVPEEFARKKWGGRWRGQRKKVAGDAVSRHRRDIDLGPDHPEFDAWRWVRVDDLLKLAVSFKRQLYLEVIGEFSTVFRD